MKTDAPGASESSPDRQTQALFNSMAEGVLVLDNSGRIQLANPSLQRLFSVPGDLRGQTPLAAFGSEELAGLVQRLHRERALHGFELAWRGADVRWLGVNTAPVFDDQGERRRSILVFPEFTPLQELAATPPEIPPHA